MSTYDARDRRYRVAAASLAGLAVGDALGASLGEGGTGWLADERRPDLPTPPWFYTDDTIMAQSIMQVLRELGVIDQDRLAMLFADRFMRAPERGYGRGAAELLTRIHRGADWAVESQSLFHGQGSFGNGAAMRVAPIGAWFAHAPEALRTAAIASAQVTHSHPEGVAGALAVALMAARFANSADEDLKGDTSLFSEIAAQLDFGEVQAGIYAIREVPLDTDPLMASRKLGSGRQVSAQDTVPFALWIVVRHADDFGAAIWSAAAAGGDRDTICAIVGGIVACRVGMDGVPIEWRYATEPWDEE